MLPSLLNEGNQGLVLSFCFLEAVPANLLWITIISPPQSKKAVFNSSSHFFFSCLFTFTFSPRFHLSPSPCLRHGPMACTIPSYAKRDGSCSRMETWMHPQGESLIKGEGFITVIHHLLSLSLWGGGKRTSAQKGRDYPLDFCNHPVLLRFPLCRLSCLLPPSTITHGKTTPQERGAGFQSQDRFAPHH